MRGDVELKPCPFCGGEAFIGEASPPEMPTSVGCRECPAMICGDDGIAAWNTRAKPVSGPVGDERREAEEQASWELRQIAALMDAASAPTHDEGDEGGPLSTYGRVAALLAASLPLLRGEDKGRFQATPSTPGSEVEASSDDGWRVPPGWKLVPDDLTLEHRRATCELLTEQQMDEYYPRSLYAVYAAFLATCPPPPSINKGLGDKGSVGSASASPSPSAESVSRETPEGEV